MLSSPFSTALAADRDTYNKKFAEAKRDFPNISSRTFSDFLASTADAIVSSISVSFPESVHAVTSALYDIGLQLSGQALIGSGARIKGVDECLKSLASSCPKIIAREPDRIFACIANASVKLATISDSMQISWCSLMQTVARELQSADEFQMAGEIAAWLCGMSHYRASALKSLSKIPERLVRSLLRLSNEEDCTAIVSQLKANPWFRPNAIGRNPKDTQEESPLRIGSFRGFGGLFIAPPLVAAQGECILASSYDEAWILSADAFGATLNAISLAEYNRVFASNPPHTLLVKDERIIELPGKSIELDVAGKLTSIALTKTTLALTTDLNHAILIVPLT